MKKGIIKARLEIVENTNIVEEAFYKLGIKIIKAESCLFSGTITYYCHCDKFEDNMHGEKIHEYAIIVTENEDKKRDFKLNIAN